MPRLLVFSTLFPHPGQPQAGLFIRERMFRVARELPLTVVAPVPWFPGQSLLRLWRPHFRPDAPRREIQQGIEVHHPRFLSVPGFGKRFDGFLLACSTWACLHRLKSQQSFELIDAHFAYPDGYAATLLGRWLDVPVTITLRGTEPRHLATPGIGPRVRKALARAARIFSVSDSLRRLALSAGVPMARTEVVGNGVDVSTFYPESRADARRQLGLALSDRVLITVGALVERKGFHRVIELMPALLRRHPDLHYLVVGGSSAEGDLRATLERQANILGVAERVHFLGARAPEDLRWPLSAADVFVLPTRNEGWANVILEAMACGLPVVTTDVGGNREVVSSETLGTVIPFDDPAQLQTALDDALGRRWDTTAILAYARAHQWDSKIESLVRAFQTLVQPKAGSSA
jgi:glycosyltransferase involved in cell wall biosynthesis